MRLTQPMSRGSLSILVALALALVFAIACTASASAACTDTAFNCFAAADGNQVSGDQTAGGDSSYQDWEDIAAQARTSLDQPKGSDTKFSGGDKETQPGSWSFITGNNTPKTDILEGWSYLNGQYLDVAFARAKQTGNTFLAFELNQHAAEPRLGQGDTLYPVRTSGDLLFTYDIATTNKLTFGLCWWDGDSQSGVWRHIDDNVAVGGSVKGCTPLSPSGPPPIAEGAVNWGSSITGFLDAQSYNPIGAGQFGEAAINFGADNPALKSFRAGAMTNACTPAGWVWLHSRASESVISQPKDLVTGTSITDPTCSFTIDKSVSLTGADGTFHHATQSNPLVALVGDTVTYAVKVSNTGTVPMSADTTDDLCDSGLSDGAGHGGSADVIAPGGSITYTCQHEVTGNESGNPFENRACANAAGMLDNGTAGGVKTPFGSDCSSAWVQSYQPGQVPPGVTPGQLVAPDQESSTPAPGNQLVLGERITPGRAQLLGPTGCTARAFHARVRGKKVAKVVFTLDGRRIKTLKRKNFRSTFAVRIDPKRLRVGVHRLVVKVTFQRGSGTKAKTMRLTFQRCPRALRAPRFTG